MTKQKTFLLPATALIFANLLLGANTTFLKMSVTTIPPYAALAIRMLLLSLLLLPFAVNSWKPLKFQDICLFIISSFCYIALGALLLNIALTKTTANNAAVITLLGPLILYLLSGKMLKERSGLKVFVGTAIAFIGSLIIIGRVGAGSSTLLGNIMILISVLITVAADLLSKSLIHKVSALQATFLMFFPSALVVSAYSLIHIHSWNISATSSKSWQGLIYSAIAVLVANVLFFYALRHKKAQQIAVYLYLDTIGTIITSWFLLGEKLPYKFVLGAVLVCYGVYIAEFSGTKNLKRGAIKSKSTDAHLA